MSFVAFLLHTQAIVRYTQGQIRRKCLYNKPQRSHFLFVGVLDIYLLQSPLHGLSLQLPNNQTENGTRWRASQPRSPRNGTFPPALPPSVQSKLTYTADNIPRPSLNLHRLRPKPSPNSSPRNAGIPTHQRLKPPNLPPPHHVTDPRA